MNTDNFYLISMESFDVIIVGAGPAGANAAEKTAENGLKTITKFFPGFSHFFPILIESSFTQNFGQQ